MKYMKKPPIFFLSFSHSSIDTPRSLYYNKKMPRSNFSERGDFLF